MTKETYYAVRIGNPKKHAPYFMKRDGGTTIPKLFHCEADAKDAATEVEVGTAVKVEVRELKST